MRLWRRLAPRERRAVLLGGLLLLPAAAYRVGLLPYVRAVSEAREALQTQRETLGRELALVAATDAGPAEAARVAEALRAEAPRLFGGSDELAATAALATYVAERARGSRVLLQQSETGVPERRDGDILALRVTLRALGDLEGVLRFLHALEEGPKLVRVERLSINQVERLGSTGARDEEVLSLSALVVAFAVASEEMP